MTSITQETSDEGLDVIRVENPGLSLAVYPQLGGKIAELIDRRTGRNWLWRNPHISRCLPRTDMNFNHELDSGGWDEVLFSVAPCNIELENGEQVSIADHGAVISVPWEVSNATVLSDGRAVIDMFVEGSSPSFRFQRRITLEAERAALTMEYTLSNTGSVSWPWMWCAHPLLAIEDGMTLALDGGQQILPEPGSSHRYLGAQAWPTLQPNNGKTIDLERVFQDPSEPPTFNAKLFVDSVVNAQVRTANGRERFNIVFDKDELPWAGLWINKRSWSGCGSEPYFNLGLEPATAPMDSLIDAISGGHARTLSPGEQRQWSLQVSLDSTGILNS